MIRFEQLEVGDIFTFNVMPNYIGENIQSQFKKVSFGYCYSLRTHNLYSMPPKRHLTEVIKVEPQPKLQGAIDAEVHTKGISED